MLCIDGDGYKLLRYNFQFLSLTQSWSKKRTKKKKIEVKKLNVKKQV